jgi:hypothetical protein
MNENIKYIFDTYPDADKIFICPDGELFLSNSLHFAKSYCRENKLDEAEIKEYTRVSYNQEISSLSKNTEPETDPNPKAKK